MTDRHVRVTLSANVREYTRSVDHAADRTEHLRDEAERFSGRHYRAKLDIDIKGLSGLIAAQSSLNRINGRYNARVNVNGAQGASRQVALIMNSLFALGPAAITGAAAASAAIMALGLTVGTVAAGLGTAILAFQGVGDAVKAMGEADLRAGQNAQEAAKRREQASRSADDARRSVVRAEQEQAQAVAAAAARVRDAEGNLAQSHQRVRYALEDLSAARQQAVRDLEDMRERSSDLVLDEEAAQIRLIEAREDLAAAERDSTSSALDLRKARLAVAEAEDRLTDVHRDAGRSREDLTAAERAGVDGMSGVVQANRAVEDAQRGVMDARQELAEAQANATQIAQDSARRVEDAERNLSEAVRDAASAMSEQSSEARKLQEQMSKLSPAGQDFAKFLYELKPVLKELQAVAQAGMFPGMEDGINELLIALPDVIFMVDKMSKAVGDMSAEAGDALNDPFWREYFRFLGEEAGPTFSNFFKILENVGRGFAGMQMTFKPLTRDIGGGLQEMTERFATWGELLGENEGFAKFVKYVRETGPVVISTLGAIAEAVGDIAVAAAPVGPVVLKIIEGLANALGFIASIPGVGSTLIAVATALGMINLALRVMAIASLSRLGMFLASLPAMAATAGTAMGVWALNMGASDRAATGLANAGSRVGTMLGAVGRVLPFVGLAAVGLGMVFDQFGSKAEEAAEKVVKGTLTMKQAIQEEAERNAARIISWDRAAVMQEKTAQATETVTAEMQKQFAAMGPMEQLQSRVAQAQADYNQKLDDFGAQNPLTLSAYDALLARTKEQEIRQIMAAEGVDEHTAALFRLRDAQMGAVNADLAYDASLLSLERAQQRATEAAAQHSTKSLEYREAAHSVREANMRVVEAAGAKAEADAIASGSSDVAGEKARAQRDKYLELAANAKDPLKSELLLLAETLRGLPDGDFKVTGTGLAQWGAPGGPMYTIDPKGVTSSRIGGLATGGLVSSVLPGYTPGRDVHTFVSPTGGALRLSGGEGILRPEATRAIGKSGLDGLNHAARFGGTAGVARYLGAGVQAFAAGGIFQNGVTPFTKIGQDIYWSIGKGLEQAMVPRIIGEINQSMAGGDALPWAMSQAGKPYGWGMVGPASYDCSGFMAAIINVMQGRNPHQRLGTTKTFPWPGMKPGMGPGLSIGNTKNAGDGVGHMAGTLAGVNVESRGGVGVLVGKRARGAQDPLFDSIWHMPGSAMMGGGGIGASSSEAQAQVRNVAARYGWGGGAQWAALVRLVEKESSWNPNAANPTSSARGLFQKMTSIWGPVESTPAGQAEWGLNYIRGRYGSPMAALDFHNRRNFYDQGGVATGRGYLAKATVAPERVLSPRQTMAFEQLVDVLSRPRAVGMGGGTTVIKNYNLTVQNAGNSTVDLQAQFTRLEQMAGV